MTDLVAHVITESEPFGGAQRNTLLTLEGLVRDGYRVDLVCGPPGGALGGAASAAGAAVHVVPELVRSPDPTNDLRCFVRLYRLFRSRDYRIVHTHSTKAGLLGRLAARAARVPIVIHTFHGFPFVLDTSLRSRIFIALERLAGRATDGSIFVAEALRAEASRWNLPDGQKTATIYSGIRFDSYAPKRSVGETKRLLGIEGAEPVIGSIGHLRPAKSQEHLIEAMTHLREKHPRVLLLLVGEGERRELLERRIRELRLAGHVRLLGERTDIPDLLQVFDVYAMSSLWEGVGRALTEAMYAARPVVVTPVYGVTELVENGVTGLTVPPQDAPALARAIDRVLSETELARRLGANARQRVIRQMSSDAMVAQIETFYAELEASKLGIVHEGAAIRCAGSRGS